MSASFSKAMKLTPILALILSTSPTVAETINQAGSWPIGRLQSEVPGFRIEDGSAKIQSLLYEGERIGGAVTEVFAFYASPHTLGKAGAHEKVPGIVLIHGGGGTAFSDWVWMWANRGYAAIAMDLSGHRPPAPRYDENGEKIPDARHQRSERTRLEKAGLDQTHREKFQSIGGMVEDDWPHHAVCNVMRAHTLLRSFPEVDATRTAVTGISWGGYTTCLVASLDNRFSAAVPVYGCGFLHEGESVQKPSIDGLGDRRQLWIEAYDPSRHLPKCEVPMFWVNGTHDKHYVLDSYAKSYRLPGSPRTIRIEPRMRHGHEAGWEPEEIRIFIDSLLRGGTPLPRLAPMHLDKDGLITVSYEAPDPVTRAELHFTRDTGLRSERNWETLPASVDSKQIRAKGLPADANTWIITVEDARGAMISTEIGFRPPLP